MNEADKGNRQRLAAILAADAAGYSRLMAQDAEATVTALDNARSAFRAGTQAHHGRIIDMAGDSVLAVFETAAGAVSAALDVQQALEAQAVGVPADRRMRFRIGIHLGDVIEKEDGSIYGDGVNIAARLEGLAQPGGITVSDAVQGAVRNRLPASFEDLGDQQVKNISDPVRAFRVHAAALGNASAVPGAASHAMAWLRRRRWTAWAGGAALVAAFGLVAVVVLTRGLRTDAGDTAMLTMSATLGTVNASPHDAIAVQEAAALGPAVSNGLGSIFRTVRVMSSAAGEAASAPVGDAERARRSSIRYVVEGDVASATGKLIVNLRLIANDKHKLAWTKRFELPGSRDSTERRVAVRNMIEQLGSAIENVETARILLKPANQLDPMELVLRSWSVMDKGQTLANAREARGLLDEALRRDPTLVPALTTLVWNVDMMNDVDPNTDHERYVVETDTFSAQAARLEPDYSKVWERRSVALLLRGSWAAALEASDRQIALDPYGRQPLHNRAWLLNMMGRPQDALVHTDKALSFGPSDQSPTLRVACEAHLLLGQPDKAIDECERASGLQTDMFLHSFLAAAYANAGDLPQARQALKAMLASVPGYTIAQLKSKRYSDHPEYQRLAEKYWYDGLRKAGLPAQ